MFHCFWEFDAWMTFQFQFEGFTVWAFDMKRACVCIFIHFSDVNQYLFLNLCFWLNFLDSSLKLRFWFLRPWFVRIEVYDAHSLILFWNLVLNSFISIIVNLFNFLLADILDVFWKIPLTILKEKLIHVFKIHFENWLFFLFNPTDVGKKIEFDEWRISWNFVKTVTIASKLRH